MPKIEILARSWDQPAKGGGYLHHATGDVVSVSDAEATRLIKAGAAKATKRKVTKTTTPEETPAEEPQETTEDAAQADEDTATEETPTPLPKPKAVATTEEWQAYAISQGMDAATANASSRNELRELYADE